MPTDFTFRLSTYLTLALACVCLGYAEWELLPEVTAFSWGVALSVGVAFVADRKGFQLSLTQANWLGLGIGAVTVVWLVYQTRRRDGLLRDEHLPWSAAILPYVGPVLMLLVLAKLFRPKHAGDWWLLQGVGLCGVGLAGALTDAEGLVVLAALYALVGVWSLTLYYIRRASGYVPPVPAAPARPGMLSAAYWVPWLFGGGKPRPAVAEAFEGVRPTAREKMSRSHFARSVRWLVAAAAVALPAFLLTPRGSGFQWELFKKMETGLSSDSGPDLSRTGELRVNPDPVFEVTAAYPDGTPKDDLPGDSRFRVASYVTYKYGLGKWVKEPPPKVFALDAARPEATAKSPVQPDFAWVGPGRFTLSYDVARKAKPEDRLPGLPLLDPVALRADRPPPVAYKNGPLWASPFLLPDAAVSHLSRETGRLTKYVQTAAPAVEDAVGPLPLHPDFTPAPLLGAALGQPFPSERIKGYARDLLPKLAAAGRVSPDVLARRHRITLQPAMSDQAAVARAFRTHLAESGEFSYTLNLKRQDRGLDPVEDFLFNTKTGHCERFAAALVLLLRASDIPAQFTVGYRGCEPQGDGKYVVRQEHAHAWADALVSRPGPAGVRDWYWLPLDPTPDGEGPGGPAEDESFLSAGTKKGKQLIADLIVGLDAEAQKRITTAAKGAVASYWPFVVGAIGLGIVGWLAVRRARRPQPVAVVAEVPPVPWYARLVEVLSVAGCPPSPGQTPREYAVAAGEFLRANPATAGVADVPGEVVALLYRERYAAAPLTEQELADVTAALDRLAAVAGRSS